MLDIICLAATVYLPSFSQASKAQRIAMATSALVIDLMPSKETKTASCSFAPVQKRSIHKGNQGLAGMESTLFGRLAAYKHYG
jgi:hypothetical protein